MKHKSRYLASLMVSFLGLVAVLRPSAQAAYVATLDEIGPNVFATGSGSFNLTALTLFGSGTAPSSFIGPSPASLVLSSGNTTTYRNISGPTSFGSGASFSQANSATGNVVGFQITSVGSLFVPAGYVSGTALGTSTATWNNATFASLGVTPGTYVWTWGSGANADSFTLQIVPEPATWLLLGIGATVFAASQRRRA